MDTFNIHPAIIGQIFLALNIVAAVFFFQKSHFFFFVSIKPNGCYQFSIVAFEFIFSKKVFEVLFNVFLRFFGNFSHYRFFFGIVIFVSIFVVTLFVASRQRIMNSIFNIRLFQSGTQSDSQDKHNNNKHQRNCACEKSDFYKPFVACCLVCSSLCNVKGFLCCGAVAGGSRGCAGRCHAYILRKDIIKSVARCNKTRFGVAMGAFFDF